MSRDNSEWPTLNVDLKDVVKILQSGGRLTRSKRNPNPAPSRHTEHKSRDRNHTLLPYDGQPCLGAYLSASNIAYSTPIKQGYFLNTKLKLLNKHHLPEHCLLFQNNYRGGYILKDVKLNPKKSKPNQFLVEERKNPQARSISSAQMGVLAVPQGLVFAVVQFQEFKKMLSGALVELKKKYRRIRLEELTQMQLAEQRERSLQSEMIEEKRSEVIIEKRSEVIEEKRSEGVEEKRSEIKSQKYAEMVEQKPSEAVQQKPSFRSEQAEEVNPCSMIAQDKQDHNRNIPSISVLELKSQSDMPIREIINQQSLQITNKINEQLIDFDEKIFMKISKGKKYVLWPSLVIQSLNTERKELEAVVEKQICEVEERGRGERQGSILRSALQELIDDKNDYLSEKKIELEESLSAKIDIIIRNINSTALEPTVVHLCCSQTTKIMTKSFIKWQQFNHEQVSHIVMHSFFRFMVDELNLQIQSLNKFKSYESSAFEGKHSLFRISKYELQSGETELCIPIRWDQLREEKKVLIRMLSDSDVSNNESLLRWVEQGKLKINLTVPRQSEEEKKFYYLIGKHISVEEGLNYIYSDFYYKTCTFIQVLRRCYPRYQITRAADREKRCIYCYYPMDDLPCYRCKFCLRYCHQECSPRHNSNETQIQELSIDIYETDKDEQVWECEECSPCNECHMAVKSNYLKCISCGHLFHAICGKLKGTANQVTEGKYTCQNCVKCRMCSNKLKNQEYIVDEKNIFCTKCHKDFKNHEYCAICMREASGKWVQCDMRQCKNWIHISCDPYFKEKESKSALDKANYICPCCRLKERRKMFKWTIEELKFFDQYQYFYDPEYEDITGYTEVISNPLCIYQMRQKASDGTYDGNTYQLMKNDLEMLVQNALTFNMPKDQPHYRAKILLIVGLKFLEIMKELLECSEEFLVNGNLQEVYSKKKKEFYADIYQNYLSYLLNFKSEKTKIEVRKVAPAPPDSQFFSSKLILSHSFSNSEFKFIINKKPHKIQNLFTIPRLAPSSWWPIRSKICFYHPDQENPIIFQCSICHQSYCCTTICFNHRTCTNCNVKGCACDAFRCGCPILRDKQKKSFEGRINNALSSSKLQKKQYTQYFRYCLKCVMDNIKTHWCYLCRGFCYYSYEQCKQCSKYYHLQCEKKSRCEEMSIFFEHKTDYRNSYSNSKLPQFCHSCSCLPKNISQLKESLIKEIKSKASKLSNINRYLPIFGYLYEQNGVRLTQQEIIHLIYQNYSGFLEKESFFNDFLINFSTIIQAEGNNRLIRSQFRDYFLNEINRKFMNQSSHSHQKCVNFVQTKEMKELKQSKKFFKIYSKWFSNLASPLSFSNSYYVKCHLEHLTSKMTHYSSIHYKELNVPYQINEQHLVATNFKEQIHFNYKNLERIKIEVITSYVSPKSKKNIYYTTKIQRYKNYLNFWNNYFSFKEGERSRDNREMVPEELENLKKKQREKMRIQYQRYLRFHADHQNLPDCIYKEESSRSLLFEPVHRQNFNPFQESNVFCRFKPLVFYKDRGNGYINNKSEMLCKYLTSFVLKIYEENKVVLRRGNTCVLSEGKSSWRVLKKYKNQSIQLKLQKKDEIWYLHINEWKGVVKEISDIVKKLKEISMEIDSFEDVAEFMGFNMTYSIFYEPNHFTHLLQTMPLDEFNRQQRKTQVIKTYEQYQWHRQGNFSLKKEEEGEVKEYNYNVTKKEIFYLKKRVHNNEEEDQIEPKVVPFITFEDVKKDLADVYSPSVKEKDNFAFKEPTNDVYVAPSKIDRLGLFIRNFTKKNTIVTEYIGEIISEAMADMREKKFHFGCYMFGLTKNNTRFQIIDATFVGNMGRYLNHCCDPNCKARIQIFNGQPRILIYTVRDVQANEELTYDYQFKIDSNERLVCKCKAHNCQGRLT